MKYTALDTGGDPTWIFILAVIFILFFMLSAVYTTRVSVAFTCLIAVILAFTGLSYAQKYDTATTNNKDTATKNLQLKYDIKDVLWDMTDTTAEPLDMNGMNNLVIETQDGQKYIFKYGTNEKTWEPSLEDMPKLGGATTTDAVTAESLLQKQENKK